MDDRGVHWWSRGSGTNVSQGLAFVGLALLAISLAMLLLLACGFDRLTSKAGIARDGIDRHKPAPPWRERDMEGIYHQVPSGHSWQYLLFVDHGLRAFPSIPEAIQRLLSAVPNAEVLLLSQNRADVTAVILRSFGVSCPIVPVSSGFYRRHNIRVTPFGIILDPTGRPRAEGLVDSGDRFLQMWRHAQYATSAGGAIDPRVMVAI